MHNVLPASAVSASCTSDIAAHLDLGTYLPMHAHYACAPNGLLCSPVMRLPHKNEQPSRCIVQMAHRAFSHVYRGSLPCASACCPSGAGRFGLTVKLLGNSSKPALGELFSGLEAAVAAAEAAEDTGEQGAGESGSSGLCSMEQLAAVKALYGFKS